jgi:dihydrofolate reductase (trimethoprim resistance protein)
MRPNNAFERIAGHRRPRLIAAPTAWSAAGPTAKDDMGQIGKVVGPQDERQLKQPEPTTFGLGDRVRKKSGAAWQGRVVGWYSTTLTPEGYAVESEAHPGSVQIYPVAALERVA